MFRLLSRFFLIVLTGLLLCGPVLADESAVKLVPVPPAVAKEFPALSLKRVGRTVVAIADGLEANMSVFVNADDTTYLITAKFSVPVPTELMPLMAELLTTGLYPDGSQLLVRLWIEKSGRVVAVAIGKKYAMLEMGFIPLEHKEV